MRISHKALRRSIKSSAIAQHSFFDLYPSVGGLVDACVSCVDDSVDIDSVSPAARVILKSNQYNSMNRIIEVPGNG